MLLTQCICSGNCLPTPLCALKAHTDLDNHEVSISTCGTAECLRASSDCRVAAWTRTMQTRTIAHLTMIPQKQSSKSSVSSCLHSTFEILALSHLCCNQSLLQTRKMRPCSRHAIFGTQNRCGLIPQASESNLRLSYISRDTTAEKIAGSEEGYVALKRHTDAHLPQGGRWQ